MIMHFRTFRLQPPHAPPSSGNASCSGRVWPPISSVSLSAVLRTSLFFGSLISRIRPYRVCVTDPGSEGDRRLFLQFGKESANPPPTDPEVHHSPQGSLHVSKTEYRGRHYQLGTVHRRFPSSIRIHRTKPCSSTDSGCSRRPLMPPGNPHPLPHEASERATFCCTCNKRLHFIKTVSGRGRQGGLPGCGCSNEASFPGESGPIRGGSRSDGFYFLHI